jgi:hypothetical protein
VNPQSPHLSQKSEEDIHPSHPKHPNRTPQGPTQGLKQPLAASSYSPSPLPANLQAIEEYLNQQKAAMTLESSSSTPLQSLAVTDNPHHQTDLGPMQWPHDFLFIDIVKGLDAYDTKVKEGKDQQTTFREVFKVPCVRQTLANKWQLLDQTCQTQEEVYDMYMAKGHVEEARWVNFECHATGKPLQGKKHLELLAIGLTKNR